MIPAKPDSVQRSFNQKIYTLVRHIPRGRVLTYGRVAALLEVPQGARAVGWAMHLSPPDVPWQRVINAQMRISTTGETAIHQRLLLESEGIVFSDADQVPDSALWQPSIWEVASLIEATQDTNLP